jgi:ribosome-binding protein aMBF1 (putative translation factor)
MLPITPIQCKMARAALGWSTKDLSERAHVAGDIVVRFENGRHEPNPDIMLAIRNAFEAAGITAACCRQENPGNKLR